MNIGFLTLVLALVWAAATGSFTLANLLFGAGLALVALYLLRDRIGDLVHMRRAGRIISLAGLFLRELIVSAIKVALLVLTPNLKAKLSPGIIAFPLTAKSDAEITLLANLITLTPGTLSVDVSEDRTMLYVHALVVRDKETLVREIASGFEAKVIEVFA